MAFWAIETILLVALLAPVTQGVKVGDTGAGTLYVLKVVKDVALVTQSTNFDNLPFLLVSGHPGYLNARSLVQFEALPDACQSSKIKFAKMYLYYLNTRKSRWRHPSTRTPFIPRYLLVHLVKKYWREIQATSSVRYSGANWTSPWLGLDGTDAKKAPQEWNPVTIVPGRPTGFVEFDITSAVRSWSSGVPNYGVVIQAVNEQEAGIGIRFASNSYKDPKMHPFATVFCAK